MSSKEWCRTWADALWLGVCFIGPIKAADEGECKKISYPVIMKKRIMTLPLPGEQLRDIVELPVTLRIEGETLFFVSSIAPQDSGTGDTYEAYVYSSKKHCWTTITKSIFKSSDQPNYFSISVYDCQHLPLCLQSPLRYKEIGSGCEKHFISWHRDLCVQICSRGILPEGIKENHYEQPQYRGGSSDGEELAVWCQPRTGGACRWRDDYWFVTEPDTTDGKWTSYAKRVQESLKQLPRYALQAHILTAQNAASVQQCLACPLQHTPLVFDPKWSDAPSASPAAVHMFNKEHGVVINVQGAVFPVAVSKKGNFYEMLSLAHGHLPDYFQRDKGAYFMQRTPDVCLIYNPNKLNSCLVCSLTAQELSFKEFVVTEGNVCSSVVTAFSLVSPVTDLSTMHKKYYGAMAIACASVGALLLCQKRRAGHVVGSICLAGAVALGAREIYAASSWAQ